MLQKIKVQTPDGTSDYLLIPDGAAFEQAKESGEIYPGMEVVYRRWIVYLLEDCCMLILTQIQPPMMEGFSFTMGGVPQ